MYYERYNEAASYICARIKDPIPETAIILGDELSEIVEKMDDKKRIPYKEVPHFPISTIFSVIWNINNKKAKIVTPKKVTEYPPKSETTTSFI